MIKLKLGTWNETMEKPSDYPHNLTVAESRNFDSTMSVNEIQLAKAVIQNPRKKLSE